MNQVFEVKTSSDNPIDTADVYRALRVFFKGTEGFEVREHSQHSIQSDGARVSAECKHGKYGACADCAIESLLSRRQTIS